MNDGLSHVDEAGRARMVDVGDKAVTQRRAVAEARVRISDALAEAIGASAVAKGNVLEVARLAGIAAAKRTDELIPLCHSLGLDAVHVDATVEAGCVHIVAEVRTSARTGVEMEALTAASVAALTVIDMGKAIDKQIVIESVRLLEKTGGRSGTYRAADPPLAASRNAPTPATPTTPATLTPPLRAGVLTISDRCSAGTTTDTSGPALVEMLRDKLAADVCATACVADDAQAIAAQLRRWACDAPRPDLVLTTGGTGLAPRDVTAEATQSIIERPHDALLELARQRCYAHTPRTYLSRGVAGTLERTLIINLPGSKRGCTQMLDALLDVLPHAIETLRGDVTDDGR